ncbi:MAG: alpha-mannosidase, partial [Chloroflexota bacterium]
MPYSYDKFEPRRILAKIEDAIYAHIQPVRVEAWLTPEPVPYEQRSSGQYRDLKLGESWGSLWECAWMHVTGEVPASARGQKVVLLIDINGEALVYDDNGVAILGLTTVNSDFDLSLGWPGKRVVEISKSAKGGETIDFWMDTGANDLFGKLPENGILREAHVSICHETLRQLFHDYFVLEELTRQLPEQSARRIKIWKSLYDAAQVMNAYTDEEAAAARKILAPELAKTGGSPSLTVSGIGHAHVDLGWLWPIRETIRKGGRTFATVIAMMERYPDYIFGASQAQLYQWVK